MNHIRNKNGISLLIFSLTLIILISQTNTIRYFLNKAEGRKADITIINQAEETITPHWKAYAQGYESEANMFQDITNLTRELQPEIIRIDHVFDAYNLVTITPSGIQLNFTKLDSVVESILQTGATPSFALSYMPPQLAHNQDVTSHPNDWNQWRSLITQFVQHYSSPSGKNIPGIYYEVWNEPDLFGNWHYGKNPKNYLTLYKHTSEAALQAANPENFYIGGPGTTAYYENWLNELYTFTQQNNLKLDFISWHRYDPDVLQFIEDVENANHWKQDKKPSLQLLITEWGPYSQNHSAYDGNASAAHSIAVTTQLINKINYAFAFEIKDGKDPDNKQYWGRWGMITHQDSGLSIKPRYRAFQLLNKLGSQKAFSFGDGTWVTSLPTITENGMSILISNYDPDGQNIETVPIHIKQLQPGQYQWKTTHLIRGIESGTIDIDTEWETQIYMPPNSVVLLELNQINP